MSIFDFLKKKDEEDKIVQNDAQALESTAIPEAAQPKTEEPISFEQKLLSELDQIKKQNDEQVSSAQSWDKWMSIAEGVNRALAKKDQARMLMNVKSPGMQSFGTDLKLDTNTAEKLMDERKNKISELLNQYKLTNQLQGKKPQPQFMKLKDEVVRVDPTTGKVEVLHKSSLSKKDQAEIGRIEAGTRLAEAQTETHKQRLLTPEEKAQNVKAATLRVQILQKKYDASNDPQQKELLQSQIDKNNAYIDNMNAKTEQTEEETDNIGIDKPLSPLEQANLNRINAQTDLYKSKVNPATNPLQEKKIQTEDLRQQDLKRKQAESKADLEDKIAKIDEHLGDLSSASKGLKKGGVTGILDSTIGKLWDMSQGNESQRTRQILDRIETQITLMNAGSLKGAISDKEINLLKQEVPSQFESEKSWRNWIEPRIEVLQNARKRLESRLSADRLGESSNKSPTKQVVKVPGADQGATKSRYTESQERGIERVMKTNNISREVAIEELKKANKL